MDKITLNLYEKAMPASYSMEEKLISVGKAGFDSMELSIDETDEKLSRLEWTLQQRLDFVKLQYGTGTRVRSICLSGHRKYPLGSRDENVRKRSMEIMKGAIDLAYDTGIGLIQLAGYDVYYEKGGPDTEEYFRENLEKSVRYAAASGINLGFETMENDFMNTTEKAMKYVDLINSPYLGVYPDIGNITNGAEDPEKDILTGKGRIFAAHLKETNPGIFRNMRYGEGRVDFEKLVPLLYDIGVRNYTCEFWYKEGTDCMKELQFAFGFFQKIFRKMQK